MADRASRKRKDAPAERPPWRIEGERDDVGPQDAPKRRSRIPRPPFDRRIYWVLIGLLTLNIFLGQLIPSPEDRRLRVPYTLFREQVIAGNVAEVNSRVDVIQGEFRKPVKFNGKGPEKSFESVRPTFAQDDELLKLLLDKDVEVNARSIDEGRSLLFTVLISFGPALLIVGLLIYILRRSGGGGGALS